VVVNVGIGNRKKSSQHPMQGNQRTTTMKTKATAKSKKPKVKVRDMKPKKDAKGGAGKDKFHEYLG